jgi:hypothetical protein
MTAVGLLAGCPDRTISEPAVSQGRVEYKDIPVTVNRDIDLLFLIDDSPSMLDKQSNLKMNFPSFVNVLNTIQGGLPNIHIGVTTSDLGAKGADDPSPLMPGVGNGPGACIGQGKAGILQTYGAPVTGAYLVDTANADGTRSTNYMGNLSDVFTMMASAGANGCGFEQHIEASKRALQPTNTANAGFLRPTAFLAIIILADEDDCSFAHSTLIDPNNMALGPLQSFRCTRFGITCDQGGGTPDQMNVTGPKGMCHSNESGQYLTKIGDYVTFFKGLKSDPNNVIMAAIVGVTDPFAVEMRAPPGTSSQPIPALAHSCSYTDMTGATEVADPAVRIKQLLDNFPNRNTFSTICQQDLSGGLQLIAELLKTVIGSPCVDGTLADVDPNTPGPQYDCSVSDVIHFGMTDAVETVLPACNNTTNPHASTNAPCWAIELDSQAMPPQMCATPTHLTLVIERGNTTPAPDTHTISYCVTCTDVINNVTKMPPADGVCDPTM